MAKKSPRIRRTFTPQFKKDAVALVEAGRSVNEVAHDLGIARSSVAALADPTPAGARGPLSRHRPARTPGRADSPAPAAAARRDRGA